MAEQTGEGAEFLFLASKRNKPPGPPSEKGGHVGFPSKLSGLMQSFWVMQRSYFPPGVAPAPGPPSTSLS